MRYKNESKQVFIEFRLINLSDNLENSTWLWFWW